MQDYEIIDFLAKHLVPGYSEDDIVLEVVILIGTMAQDKRASNLMANTSLIPALVELLLRIADFISVSNTSQKNKKMTKLFYKLFSPFSDYFNTKKVAYTYCKTQVIPFSTAILTT
jgi:hypothetical protein